MEKRKNPFAKSWIEEHRNLYEHIKDVLHEHKLRITDFSRLNEKSQKNVMAIAQRRLQRDYEMMKAFQMIMEYEAHRKKESEG